MSFERSEALKHNLIDKSKELLLLHRFGQSAEHGDEGSFQCIQLEESPVSHSTHHHTDA